MRYNVDCPHCGAPRSLPDYGLWPDGSRLYVYPGRTEPQQCLDCHRWMRVIVGNTVDTAEKWEPSEEAKRRFPPDGIYDGKYPCVCVAGCKDPHCGCPACHVEYSDGAYD